MSQTPNQTNDQHTVEELSQLPRSQLSRLNKDTLIDCILSFKEGDAAIIRSLETKLQAISNDLADVKSKLTSPESAINKKLDSLQEQINKQAEIISRQQQFLETVDRKERETRLVVMGVPENGESLSGATSDQDKLKKIWSELGEDLTSFTHYRLGREQIDGRKRPILVTLGAKAIRDQVLTKTKRLKDAGDSFSRIYVKKDVHPHVRNEWKRLKDAENVEKNKPENIGCVIRLDPRARILYRDNVEIDKWNPAPF